MEERLEYLCHSVEKYRDLIFRTHDYLWEHAESGFKEWETTAYLEREYESLGYKLTKPGDIPGFYTDVDTGIPGPKILCIGEMDSLIIPSHPAARKDTACVHACGHHAQSAALLGLAAALKEPGVLQGLSGSIRLMAVPAEELTDLPYRENLRKRGTIRYYGGKQEFMYRGYMQNCDMAFMVHTSYGDGSFEFPNLGDDGCHIKTVRFTGKATHTGYSPHLGIDALAAGSLALAALNVVRETFKDDDYMRIQIGELSGDSTTCILNYKIRAATMEALHRLNKQCDLAVAGAAVSVGASVNIEDRAGYMPMQNDPVMTAVFEEAANSLDPDHPVEIGHAWSAGCTDMGDVSQLMPVIHPYCLGAAGRAHTDSYYIESVEKACVMSAKCQLAMLDMFLSNGARKAKEVIDSWQPKYAASDEFFAQLDGLMKDYDPISQNENGQIIISF